MRNNYQFKLIDGKFSLEEADTILTALINYKIDFNKREDFSNHIRFNKEIDHSKKRIQELNKTKEQIKNLIIENKTSDSQIIIKSDIIIEFE